MGSRETLYGVSASDLPALCEELSTLMRSEFFLSLVRPLRVGQRGGRGVGLVCSPAYWTAVLQATHFENSPAKANRTARAHRDWRKRGISKNQWALVLPEVCSSRSRGSDSAFSCELGPRPMCGPVSPSRSRTSSLRSRESSKSRGSKSMETSRAHGDHWRSSSRIPCDRFVTDVRGFRRSAVAADRQKPR